MEQKPQHYFEKQKQWVVRYLERAIHRLHRQIDGLEEERKKLLQWEEHHHQAILLQSNLYRVKKGQEVVIVEDWENEGRQVKIMLDPHKDIHEQLKAMFKTARKLKGGLEHLATRHEKLSRQEGKLTARLETLSAIDNNEALDTFCIQYHIQHHPKDKKDTLEKALPYRTFFTPTGAEIWVGKGAVENDALTLQHARGLDWWFHANGVAGSHVVLRARREEESPRSEDEQAAAQLAFHYSKARVRGEGEVIVTQCKHIRKGDRGKPGKVRVGPHKVIYLRYDPHIFETLTQK